MNAKFRWHHISVLSIVEGGTKICHTLDYLERVPDLAMYKYNKGICN